MSEAETFFFSESMRHARTLPIGDCRTFLNGMLLSLGARSDDAGTIIGSALNGIDQTDAQLDLIASGQLKLNLEPQA